jgi:hypothetical protein
MSVKFGHLADLHCCNRTQTFVAMWGNEWRIYNTWLARLNDCLDELLAAEVFLLLMPGDNHNGNNLVNSEESFQATFGQLLAAIQAHDWWAAGGRVLAVGGNHEATTPLTYLGKDYLRDFYLALQPAGTLNYPAGGFGFYRYETSDVIYVGYDGLYLEYGGTAEEWQALLSAWGQEGKPIVFSMHGSPSAPVYGPWLEYIWPVCPNAQLIVSGHDHSVITSGYQFAYYDDIALVYGRGSIRANEPQHTEDDPPDDDYTHGAHSIVEFTPFAFKGTGSLRRRANVQITGYRNAGTFSRVHDRFLIGASL